MRKIILFILLATSNAGFAAPSTSASLLDVTKVFKQPHHRLSLDARDTTMSYAGEDVTQKINLPLSLLA